MRAECSGNSGIICGSHIHHGSTDTSEEKRNIGSLKNTQSTSKVKRDTTYDDFPDESEIDTQAYQMAPFNYNDLSELYAYYGLPDISNEKRFLGEWFICCNYSVN